MRGLQSRGLRLSRSQSLGPLAQASLIFATCWQQQVNTTQYLASWQAVHLQRIPYWVISTSGTRQNILIPRVAPGWRLFGESKQSQWPFVLGMKLLSVSCCSVPFLQDILKVPPACCSPASPPFCLYLMDCRRTLHDPNCRSICWQAHRLWHQTVHAKTNTPHININRIAVEKLKILTCSPGLNFPHPSDIFSKILEPDNMSRLVLKVSYICACRCWMSKDTLDCLSKCLITSFHGNIVLLNGNAATHIDVVFQSHCNDICLCRFSNWSPSSMTQPVVGLQSHWTVYCQYPAVSSNVGAISHAIVAQIVLSAQIGATRHPQ